MRVTIYLQCADYDEARSVVDRIDKLIISTSEQREHVIVCTPRNEEFGALIETTQKRLPRLLEEMRREGFL